MPAGRRKIMYAALTGILITLAILTVSGSMPLFLYKPGFYGPLLGILGGALGILVATRKEGNSAKGHKGTLIAWLVLGACLLFWITTMALAGLRQK